LTLPRQSLQGELLAILEEAIQPRSLSIDEARKRLAGLRFGTSEEAVALVREDRDAR
jgi:hypothetical protein